MKTVAAVTGFLNVHIAWYDLIPVYCITVHCTLYCAQCTVYLHVHVCVIDCGEGNTVLYTPERRSRDGVY